MGEVSLIGSPLCRRFRKMKVVVLAEAEKLDTPLDVHEIGDTDSLAQLNPLSLPRMYIQGNLITSKNPPKPEDIRAVLWEGYKGERMQ